MARMFNVLFFFLASKSNSLYFFLIPNFLKMVANMKIKCYYHMTLLSWIKITFKEGKNEDTSM
jgi:hypothetical protein